MVIQRVVKYVNQLIPMLNFKRQGDTLFAVLGDSDGDSCLFNGLLASCWPLMQDNWPLTAVMECQGDNGMFYRSPLRRATDNDGFGSKFSRDQAHGVLLAAINPKFKEERWNKWLDYIATTRPCLTKIGNTCLIKSPIYQYAKGDSRTQITPCMWAMMKRIADNRGWLPRLDMRTFEKSDGDASVIESEACEQGYRLHLNAVQAYIKLLIDQSREYSQRVGEICYKRVPDNLFYEFLATRSIDEDFVERYFQIAPDPWGHFGNAWVWEKSSVASELDTTCGWDFVFMGHLIIKHFKPKNASSQVA